MSRTKWYSLCALVLLLVAGAGVLGHRIGELNQGRRAVKAHAAKWIWNAQRGRKELTYFTEDSWITGRYVKYSATNLTHVRWWSLDGVIQYSQTCEHCFIQTAIISRSMRDKEPDK